MIYILKEFLFNIFTWFIIQKKKKIRVYTPINLLLIVKEASYLIISLLIWKYLSMRIIRNWNIKNNFY